MSPGPLPPPPRPLDRRRAARVPARIGGYIQAGGEDEQELALVRNISRTGLLALTRAVFDPDEQVTVAMLFPKNRNEKSAAGRVTRVERSEMPVADTWPYRVAVRFDEPIVFARDLWALSDLQARLGLVRGPDRRADG